MNIEKVKELIEEAPAGKYRLLDGTTVLPQRTKAEWKKFNKSIRRAKRYMKRMKNKAPASWEKLDETVRARMRLTHSEDQIPHMRIKKAK